MGAIVVPPGGPAALNPELPALENLVIKYRLLYETPPAGTAGWSAILQQGIECAWRAPPGPLPAAVEPVGPSHPRFRTPAMVSPFEVAYLGARRLTAWDHLLLGFLAETGQRTSHSVRVPVSVPHRLAAWFVAVAGEHLETSQELKAKAAYYGQTRLWDLARKVWASKQGPVWDEAEDHRRRLAREA